MELKVKLYQGTPDHIVDVCRLDKLVANIYGQWNSTVFEFDFIEFLSELRWYWPMFGFFVYLFNFAFFCEMASVQYFP